MSKTTLAQLLAVAIFFLINFTFWFAHIDEISMTKMQNEQIAQLQNQTEILRTQVNQVEVMIDPLPIETYVEMKITDSKGKSLPRCKKRRNSISVVLIKQGYF